MTDGDSDDTKARTTGAAAKPDGAYDYDRAISYTFWLLGRRDYTEKELRDRVARKGATPADVERVIARLEDLGLIDDAKYAAAYVRSRQRKKGPFAIRRELLRKGISETLAETALTPLTEQRQLAAATDIVSRHGWRFEDRDARAKSRAYAFLARRGFPPDIVGEALRASGLFDEP